MPTRARALSFEIVCARLTSDALRALEEVKIEMELELSRLRREVSELLESSVKHTGIIDNLILQSEDKDSTISRRDNHIRELESELHSTQTKLRSDTQRFELELEKAGTHLALTEADRDQIERLRVDAVDEKKVEALRFKDEQEAHGKTSAELLQAQTLECCSNILLVYAALTRCSNNPKPYLALCSQYTRPLTFENFAAGKRCADIQGGVVAGATARCHSPSAGAACARDRHARIGKAGRREAA